MATALAHHDQVLATTVREHDGRLLKTTGDGCLAVFEDPSGALEAAADAQQRLREINVDGEPLRVRMGMHTGIAIERDDDFFGPVVNRAARIMAAAHGGQVLASKRTVELARTRLDTLAVGSHRLRDLLEPEDLFQLMVPGQPPSFPPVRSLDAFEHNLPIQRSVLFGAEDAVAAIADLVHRHRLVSLTGVGGVGKTRLAIEVGGRVLDQFDAVLFVELAAVGDGSRVREAVAIAAGLPAHEATDSDDRDPLTGFFASRRILVILDNCEHVLDDAAAFVDDVLASSQSTVLATSREALSIEGERVWRVASLDPTGGAVDLFVDRAASVGVTLAATGEHRRLLEDICAQLDGIPLALELAASRTAHLAPEDIASRLGDRFRLLTGGRRTARQRQQTLQATLDWSHDLLTGDEQVLLRRVSTFLGGFGLAGAEAVAPDIGDVLSALSALVDKSLVVAETDAGRTRYRMLESVRLYGQDRLVAAGEAVAARSAHCRWVLDSLRGFRLEDLAGYLAFEPGAGWWLTAERANVVAAMQWAEDDGDLVTMGRIAGRAIGLLELGLLLDEDNRIFGRDDVEMALSEADDIAAYLVASALNANSIGDFSGQRELSARAVDLGAPHPMDIGARSLLVNAVATVDPRAALAMAEDALASLGPVDPRLRALMIVRQADAAIMGGDLELGLTLQTAAEDAMSWSNGERGVLLHVLGDDSGALAYAERLTQTVLTSLGAFWVRFRSAMIRGLALSGMGRLDDAREALIETATSVEQFPMRLVDHDALVGFAALAWHEGDAARASHILAVLAAHGVWTRTPATFAAYRHYRDLVRGVMSRDEIAATRAAAAGVSIGDALAAEVARARAALVR